MDILQGFLDILRFGERDSSNIGKQKFLSASFIGGPRDMRQRYMDAIALVRCFGKPDLFITMICNLTWTEIKEYLWTIDEAQNRPDLISRVFRAKVEELKTYISKRNIFGKIVAFMYTVEFQKREAYDGIISAELSDANLDKKLRSLVLKHMMHGPCGNLNPTNSCMKKNGLCKFNYPKSFAEQTAKGSDSYPIYKRRNTGEVVKVREQYLDNSWVVPYNAFLLGKFNCHMNVEVCSDIKVVKYIYKYICKGHDKIAFYVHNNDTNKEIDEIKEYQSARWVSPPEAVCRLFGFSISEMYPSVYHLQVHLKEQQFVFFKGNTDINTIVNNPMIKKIMLTEFFQMNRSNKDAIKLNLLYKEFPEHFVWSTTDKTWIRRQQRCAIEAASYQMSYSLRRLFATLLVYCNPANPKEIWKQFEESMLEDYRVLPNVERKDIQYQVLNQINDVLHSMGHNVNEYELIPESVRPSILEKEANEELFFIDGPGGTGKTFLCRALLAIVRSKGYIALATATSGVAASILPGGRTANSRFKIPIDIDENFSCNISKQSSAAYSRVVLTTKNDFVNEINDIIIAKFPEKVTTFVGFDETVEPNDQSQFEDLLHSLNPAGLPPYKLTLKENCPFILLCNLNPYEGLCNGTRLICCDIKTNVISAKIATGDFKNKHVFIPRIPLLS
ncbi:uncharacterized protein [Nicotiana sylvestris]|uniref:uncharacterized protein n=1 Tax=Nicotiana sylvestris TaxID=4096 RepID=UPI00388C44A2